MTTNYTKLNKPTGTPYTALTKPTTKIQIKGSPIGLLLALTYATSTGTAYTKLAKAVGTSYTKLTKAT